MNTSTQATATGERADLLAALAKARYFLRFTVRDLTDDQAQHCGHADIIRESLDGAKTMG